MSVLAEMYFEELKRARSRIVELEAENQTHLDNATFWREKSYKAEAALDSFLGPDGGKTVIELRAALAERDRTCATCGNEAPNENHAMCVGSVRLCNRWAERTRP